MNTLKLKHLLMKVLTLVIGVVIPGVVFAQTTPTTPSSSTSSTGTDAISMLVNLSKSYPALFELVTGGAFLIGIVLTLSAIYYLRAYGESRTMMSSNTTIKTPVVLLIVGAIFLFLPSAFNTMLITAFGSGSPMSYDQSSSSIDPVVMQALVGLVQLVGVIAFIRGWMILVASAKQPGGQATTGKALTHIIGGLFAINIVGVVHIVWNTFGFS